MEYKLPLTPEALDHLLAQVLMNQAIEGYVLTPDEVANVRRQLGEKYLHPSNTAWSPSWNCLTAIARILRRPDLLRGGREMEMFASGIALTASTDTGEAWQEVLRAHVARRRGLVLAALEYLRHGPPSYEVTDQIRLKRLTRGVAAAREAGIPEQVERLLHEPT